MVTFYEEQDLISFGKYMVSEERFKAVTDLMNSEEYKGTLTEEQREDLLQSVTQFDLQSWYEKEIQNAAEMRQMMQEEANSSTEWSPAPEEMEELQDDEFTKEENNELSE